MGDASACLQMITEGRSRQHLGRFLPQARELLLQGGLVDPARRGG